MPAARRPARRRPPGRRRCAAARRPLPPEELHFLVLLASYPELRRSPDAARGGELLVDPAMRQLFRGLAEQVALTGQLDIPAWLDSAPADVRDTVGAALMDGSIAMSPILRRHFQSSAKLQLLRVDAEIAMNQKLQSEAQGAGDDAPLRAMTGTRTFELEQTKEGLKAALQRP